MQLFQSLTSVFGGLDIPIAMQIVFCISAILFVLPLIGGQAADRLRRLQYKNYPILGDSSWWGHRAWFFTQWCQNSMNLLMDGYYKLSKKHIKWATWVFDDLFYVFPHSMLDELKSFPPDKLNFSQIVDDQFLWHQFMGNTLTEREYVSIVHKYLGANLHDMTELFVEVIDKAMLRRLQPSTNTRGWKCIMLWDGILDICYDVVGEIMLGDIGCSEEYFEHSKGFVESVSAWSGAMHMLPGFLRVPHFKLSSGGRKIRHHLHQARVLIKSALATVEAENTATGRSGVAQGFLKQSSHNRYADRYEEIANQMLILTFAAAPMWNMILNQVIQNILAYPEYRFEIKEEVERSLNENGGWTKAAFLRMPKLDSFVRETMRTTPPIMYTVQRKAMQQVQLSDGTLLSPGEKLMIPTRALLNDPDIYPNPDRFDPLRFYDQSTDSVQIASVTQTSEFPVFGYGNQTCPGRFFASFATKVMCARLLTDYELEFVPKRFGKPVDWPFAASLMPNLDTFVSFRRKISS